MKATRKNIEHSEEVSIRLGGLKIAITSPSISVKFFLLVIVVLSFIISFITLIAYLISEEKIILMDVIKGIGGVILGLILVYFIGIFLDLSQSYLNKIKDKRKRQVIEEKYDFLKLKIEMQKLLIERKFKDSVQLDLLQEHLKKLEIEELKTELEKIEELKATH